MVVFPLSPETKILLEAEVLVFALLKVEFVDLLFLYVEAEEEQLASPA